ncbi:MAG: MFS transporter [Deltaproteobacteria bacterium]|nr:MFS transporter [Deltaproteobacteria bacterium]
MTGTFLTFLFMNFCVFMGFNMLLPTLPLFLEAAGLTEQEIGVVFGSFTISAVAARLCASRISLAFGALASARTGLFVLAAGTLAFLLRDSVPSLMAARLLQGLGAGLTSTLMMSLASRTMPPSRIGEGMGYLGLGPTMSMAIGPFTGLYLSETWGYEYMFAAASACCLAAGLVSLKLRDIVFPARPEPGGKGERTGESGEETEGNGMAAEEEAAEPGKAPDGKAALPEEPCGAVPERPADEDVRTYRTSAPAPRAEADSPEHSKSPGRRKPSCIEWDAVPPSFLMLVYGSAVSAVSAYLALYAAERGMPSAAEFFVVSTAGTVVSRLWAGRLYDSRGHRHVIPPALALVSLAVALILSVPGRTLMYTSAVVYGLGNGALFPSLQTLALTSVPPERRTTASAYFFVSFDIGLGAGSVVMGGLAGMFTSYRAVYVAALAFLAFMSASYFLLYRPGGRKP